MESTRGHQVNSRPSSLLIDQFTSRVEKDLTTQRDMGVSILYIFCFLCSLSVEHSIGIAEPDHFPARDL